MRSQRTSQRARHVPTPSVLLLGLLALLAAVSGLAAQPLLPAGPEIRLQGVPYYAPDGRLLVGETVRDTAGDVDAVVRFHSPDGGTPLGPAIRVHAGVAGEQAFGDLAFAADGGFAVLWTHHQPPAARQVYWRRFGPDGTPLGPESRAHGPIERHHFAGKIAATPGGGWLLTWSTIAEVIEDPFEPITVYNLVARRFGPDGGARTAAFRFGGTLDSPLVEDLAVAPDGTALAVAADYRGELFYQVSGYLIGRDAALGPVELSPDDSYWEDFPAVEARADGGFVAVWWDGTLGGVALRRIERDGSSGEPVLIVPAPDQGIAGVKAALLPDDRLLVVWSEGTANQIATGVYGRIFTTGGTPLAETFRIHLTAMNGDRASRRVAVHPDGSALVTWFGGAVHRRPRLARRLETGCTAGAGALGSLCLQGGRFRVDGNWAANAMGGPVRGVGLTPDTGYLWFFQRSNPELLVKVLDARALNGHYWVFFGAVTNASYTVSVTDTATGAQKFYRNIFGRQSSIADLGAFPAAPGPAGDALGAASGPAGASAAALPWLPRAGCAAGGPTLCLLGGRFEVEVAWQDFAGGTGTGRAVPLTDEAGTFWFFEDSNLELLVKMLDGRALDGHFWLFYGALSNVGYTLRVLDTETGAVRTYTNPPGRLASFADTAAF